MHGEGGSVGRRTAVAILTLAIAALALILFREISGLVRRPDAKPTGRLVDHGAWLAYLPEGWQPEERRPLVFALSPTGDARWAISAWVSVADRHRWLVAASKEFRNGQEFGPSLKRIEAELDAVERTYAVDAGRVVVTGLSGGGMGSHAFSKFFPDRVSAVVINTGMMHAPFMTGDYPEGKRAVFLASPTDFRYTEMKRDRRFLEEHHWATLWIEFPGGHTMAPASVYEQAAAWLEGHLPSVSGQGPR